MVSREMFTASSDNLHFGSTVCVLVTRDDQSVTPQVKFYLFERRVKTVAEAAGLAEGLHVNCHIFET